MCEDWDLSNLPRIKVMDKRKHSSNGLPAKYSFPPRVGCSSTASKQALAMIRVPANSSRIDSQLWAENVRWYAVCWVFNIPTILSLKDFSASKALIVKTPSRVSPNRAYIGDRHTESSCTGFDMLEILWDLLNDTLNHVRRLLHTLFNSLYVTVKKRCWWT